MRSGGRLNRILPIAAIVLAATSCWTAFSLFTHITLEDALITFRYARHVASGQGFVFNPGEHVLGTTTPLLTLALGLAGAIAGADSIPLIANVLMILAAAGAGVMTCRALEALGCARGLALFSAAALMLHPDLLWMVTGGMETPLVLLFMATGLWALAVGRYSAAAAAAALLALTRIDGLAWSAGILACIAWQERAAVRRSLLIFTAIVLPWVIFAFAWFGSPIPHSLIAKRVIGGGYNIFNLSPLLEHLSWNGPYFAWSFPFAAPLGYAAFAIGAWAIFRKPSPPALRLVVLFPFVLSAAFYVGRAPWFGWYMAPAGYASVIVGAIGVWHVARLLTDSAIFRRLPRRAFPAAAAVFFGGYFALTGARGMEVAANERVRQINEDGLRRNVGLWLRDNTPRDAVVAMEAVGYQAYYSDRRVIDFAGLVSPAVVAIRRASPSNAEAFDRVLRDLKPDYLVLRSFEVDQNMHYHGGRLFESPEHWAYFWDHYDEEDRFEAPLPAVWGRTAYLTIFRRLPGP